LPDRDGWINRTPAKFPLRGFFSSNRFAKTKIEENWCQNHLADQPRFQLLEEVDADLAAAAHKQGCLACGGRLHRADYGRKPRGGPQWDERFSFWFQSDTRVVLEI